MRDSNCKKWDHKSAYPVTILGDAGKVLTLPRIKNENKEVGDYIL